MADHDEHEAVPRRRDGAVDGEVAEPGPEDDLAEEFEVAVPPRGSSFGGLAEQEVFPGEAVEVEAAEGEERVVQPVLPGDGPSGDEVEVHYAVVVGRAEGAEEACRDGDEGHVFDVWVVFRRVGDNVVDVMVALPPAYGETTQKVGNEDAYASIDVKIVRDAHVAGVMSGKDELVPEHAQKSARKSVVGVA